MFVEKEKAACGMAKVVPSCLGIGNLSSLPSPEVAHHGIKVTPLSIFNMTPVFTRVFLSAKGKYRGKLIKRMRRNKTIFRFTGIKFSTGSRY